MLFLIINTRIVVAIGYKIVDRLKKRKMHYIVIWWKGEKDLTKTITIRIDEELKTQLHELMSELGMDITTFFTIAAKQAVREQAIPFKICANEKMQERKVVNSFSQAQFEPVNIWYDHNNVQHTINSSKKWVNKEVIDCYI